MAHLVSLPPEILHNIFQWLRPHDLLLLPRVCRIFRAFAYKNRRLCRDVYLNDTPEDTKLDWETELRDVVRLQVICRRKTVADKEHELDFVSQTLNRLLKHASSLRHTTEISHTHAASRNAEFLAELFKEPSTREAFLQRSFLFERVRNECHRPMRWADSVKQEHQQSAKLHCLYGRPITNLGRLRSTRTYPYAVSKVYDLRQYTVLTRWGPFMNDATGRVDWEKVEAILVVLGQNLNQRRVTKLFGDVWDCPFSGSWPKSYIPSPTVELSPLEASDPYGVTGTWYRAICYLDYNDFFKYNFPVGVDIPDDAPRPPLSVGEEMRLIIMRARVTAIQSPGPDDGQELPVVHFTGVSRPLDGSWDDNANSDLRGTVRLTKEGEVRWTTISVFQGEERWRSEGIQIGGLRSARGVVGHWFDKDYDAQGPVGPTAFWKASESSATNDTIQSLLTNDFLLAYTTMAYMDDSDPEAEMDYEDEEEDDDMDEDFDGEPVSNELPGLLLDAQLEVADIMQQAGQG
ncbi:F-box-like domain-containing protein [Hirsutella rhossiliensis]|uniref:F-box-like domain-containing protein n=1 Tax=Hirsutella rhossiliensis TaxID=111463 RepID=A0A9P8N2Q6_9HYPO|nr:f-box-like domain-containing protein [Hirsutella rhossiliensis]KAH0965837.1 f-box-like domain-containing protein [Hirsutella rhossiliensis]